jgi:hypothetical protein
MAKPGLLLILKQINLFRVETKPFQATNADAYKFYRLTVIALKGDGDAFQFSEWRLLIDHN